MKYEVSYTSGATGYGWEEKVNTITEVMNLIEGLKTTYSAYVSVYDYQLHDFVYYKRALSFDPEINLITSMKRDLRTTTRKVKVKEAYA